MTVSDWEKTPSSNTIFNGDKLLSKGRTLVMGILNVTPDSFSDGGNFVADDAALQQAELMIEQGADIIDVGGESTRPYAEKVSVEEEIARVLPAINAIRRRHNVPISIDTTKSEVARQALDAGADIINDVSAFRFDQQMVNVAGQAKCPVIIMHMQGSPETMQDNPQYADIINDLKTFFMERINWAIDHGITRKNLIIDPGIGFGKTVQHNLIIFKHLEELHEIGCPILMGHSRKSFIGKILGLEIHERDVISAALSFFLAYKKAAIIRVHDVEKTIQSIQMAEAILAVP